MNIPEDQLTGDGYISVRTIMKRYGISRMGLWRWMDRPHVGFPKPIRVGEARYWVKSEVAAWEADRLAARDAA